MTDLRKSATLFRRGQCGCSNK